ncbi:cytochrome c oxidase subunit 1 [Natronoarchaeum philippinense]|uniref:Cytochrome c oxidase subunit 1 n=1 Tax=Natronoarchaeum philippinense TaxID=558529 RepID=A0A285N0H6_NATPI|nr:cbb3-type cytochrome c oxidase subunit I [Natronoarchaeum philippinense]SNZ02942.1 cytochrome c oxidase subunit 1 [Natronoarchaeum philippinense]
MVNGQLILTVLMGVFLLAVAAALTRVESWRSYTPAGGATGGETAHGHQEKPSGILRWLTTVDHKDIGILYGTYAVIAFAWGGLAVMLMRLELSLPGETLIGASLYNALLTSHGITMLFLFGTPVIAAFGNYFIPLLIDADDMAFPRINAIAFWLLPIAALLVWGGFLLAPFMENVAGAQTSWTMYPPLSSSSTAMGTPAGPNGVINLGADLMMLGLHLSGVSATMGAINFIATIFTERGEDVGWHNLDILSWTILTQSGLILFAFPLLGSALLMLLADRNFGTLFFAPEGGGPILWQHLFWFFGHPEVYILVLPPMGIISYVLPRFAGRKLFGFKFVVYSTLAIGVLSFGVWAHHMFASGMDPRLEAAFMAVTLSIAIPSAVKTFNWITTLWNGDIRLTAPMLFSIGFISNFILGGVTGVFLAAVPVNQALHETYYVVGHFHYIVMGAIGFSVFVGLYYWFPIYTGRMYQQRLAKWHFWLSMIGTNVVFFAMILLGYGGMPRKYANYEFPVGPTGMFTDLHQIATFGAILLFVGQLIFLWNFIVSWLEGPRVTDDDPWNLEEHGMKGREWDWFGEHKLLPMADGGEPEDDAEVATDGGERDAVDQASTADE